MNRQVSRSALGKKRLKAIEQRSCWVPELVDTGRNVSGKLSHCGGNGIDLGRSVFYKLIEPLENGWFTVRVCDGIFLGVRDGVLNSVR